MEHLLRRPAVETSGTAAEAKSTHCCSLNITQEIRDYAAQQEAEAGMAAKAEEFRARGGEIYVGQ